ncbi:DUF1054 domain-containing protein [Oceanobacillus kimchii]|uniref:UPF0637 protein MACH08_16460 n=1 Tax=Oceanobacillus kimchii TaxID=746691 RepID=A0ABQ5TMT2_9BACI|nr:DUF1054 domain-containing protein [Oceanobacillus kimchii]MCT1576410.1 DUF1054 domain-containing protein [Oceanobacillus kimchii]MCT2136046.1 DUF1054 domain-containing protein [Oceanobacillus kimchii]GLO65862.1 UPF0637 protein [Oceanobacillus kimchii]
MNGFTNKDFETFNINGLDERMEAIQTRIQPKFQQIGESLAEDLSKKTNNDLFLHIAKHARRTVNPPNDTWLAIADNKRGYKKHPHFQLGVFDDHVFIWLAFIYELPNKSKIASALIDHFNEIKELPSTFVVSLDHTKKEAIPLTDLNKSHLERFRDVKKAEFLVGKHIKKGDPILANGEELYQMTLDVFDHLLPLYQLAIDSRDA